MYYLTLKDKEKYLSSGFLTVPFLPDNFVAEKVKLDYYNRLNKGKDANIIDSLMRFIHSNISYSSDLYIQKQKFQRTAEEVWNSKHTSGCTDTAIVFATLARQLKIPTTILHTAQYEWLERLKKGEDYKQHKGHSFCECFYENKWILVDPTAGKIMMDYNPQKIVLDYALDNSNTFIPYFRGIDIGQKMTVKQHNEIMDEECLKL